MKKKKKKEANSGKNRKEMAGKLSIINYFSILNATDVELIQTFIKDRWDITAVFCSSP